MKRAFLSALIALTAVSALSLTSFDAEAKRLGGGGSAGMKRTTPSQTDAGKASPPAQQAAPAPQQAAPAVPAAAGAAAAAPKRNWMGPIAGLAAGLGLAALASHFGMGGALANIMTMLLIGGALLLLVTFLMRRFGSAKAQAPGMQYAGAGAGAGNGSGNNMPMPMPMPFQTAQPSPAQQPTSLAPLAAVPSAPAAQAAAGSSEDAAFEQLAKRVFIRLQAANDAGDQTDLRRFTTPEMYGAVQQELLDRKGAVQRTDVLQLDARVIERVQENSQQIVSVRFWGLIREQSEAAAENFDEVWHLVRPLDESREWAIAGIQATV